MRNVAIRSDREPSLRYHVNLTVGFTRSRLFIATDYKSKGTTDEQIDGCDPILEVESIQGKKNRGNKTRYLVKWKGHVEMTWEPKSYLKDCKDMVQAFEDKANKAKARLKQATATSCEARLVRLRVAIVQS